MDQLCFFFVNDAAQPGDDRAADFFIKNDILNLYTFLFQLLRFGYSPLGNHSYVNTPGTQATDQHPVG